MTTADRPEQRCARVPRRAVPGFMMEACRGLLDILYPPKCLACGALDPGPLCDACRASFLPVDEPVCRRCGTTIQFGECRDCARGVPQFTERIRAAGRFEGTLRAAILQLKYHNKRALAAPLGEFLAEYLLTRPFGDVSFDILIPVPLHPSKERRREFNQAALMGREVARALGIPLCGDALQRRRRTGAQAELGREDRRRNIAGAFHVRLPTAVSGRRVLLVDDVVTTCYTVDECARALIDAGASVVYVAAAAREA